MKTKELIARLQKEDPSGELECVVGGEDIYFCERQPYYYDGTPVLLVHDESKRPFYSIVGLRIPGSGEKVRIHTVAAEGVWIDHPDAPIEYETEHVRQKYETGMERTRAECREARAQVDAHVTKSAPKSPEKAK